jgi:hypothetical protein
VTWRIVISPGATVQVATILRGVITGWTHVPTHQDHTSGAPCNAPKRLPLLSGGFAMVVYVPGGAFHHQNVHAGSVGVTTSHT